MSGEVLAGIVAGLVTTFGGIITVVIRADIKARKEDSQRLWDMIATLQSKLLADDGDGHEHSGGFLVLLSQEVAALRAEVRSMREQLEEGQAQFSKHEESLVSLGEGLAEMHALIGRIPCRRGDKCPLGLEAEADE